MTQLVCCKCMMMYNDNMVLAHLTTNQGVVGSNPAGRATTLDLLVKDY